MLAKIVAHSPEEVFGHITKSVSLTREHEHVKSLVCLDKCVYHSHCVCRVYIIVNVAMNKHQMAFKILSYLRVPVNAVFECSIALFGNLLQYSVVLLTPPAVVDIVFVVTCA